MIKCPKCNNTEHNFRYNEIYAWRLYVQNEDDTWAPQDEIKGEKETGKVKYECRIIKCGHTWID
jgi:hypothetical protein